MALARRANAGNARASRVGALLEGAERVGVSLLGLCPSISLASREAKHIVVNDEHLALLDLAEVL